MAAGAATLDSRATPWGELSAMGTPPIAWNDDLLFIRGRLRTDKGAGMAYYQQCSLTAFFLLRTDTVDLIRKCSMTIANKKETAN